MNKLLEQQIKALEKQNRSLQQELRPFQDPLFTPFSSEEIAVFAKRYIETNPLIIKVLLSDKQKKEITGEDYGNY